MAIEIVPVMGEPRLENAFASLGVKFANRSPMRLPRFRYVERALLSPLENFFFKRGQCQCWIARQGKRLLGRIGAMIDTEIYAHQKTYKMGFIGLYEAEPNAELAAALINTATDYLRKAGCVSACGPVDFSIYHGYRYQTDHFDSQCYLGEPRNPAHYLDHYLANGFKPSYQWQSHQLCLDAVDKLACKLAVDYQQSLDLGYCYIPYQHYTPATALELTWHLIQKTYVGMPGFVELSLADFTRQFSTLHKMTDMQASTFLFDPDNNVIGYSLVLQDKAAAVRAMHGSTGWWARCKFILNNRKGNLANAYQTGIYYRAIKAAASLGMRKNKRPLSLSKGLYYHSGQQIRKNPNYKSIIIALLRSDTPNIHLTHAFSSETRHYQLFTRRL